jgi:hypothetical protein
MTILFRVRIEDELHEVRVEVEGDPGPDQWAGLEEFAVSTAWLEHRRLLPRGVVNALA